MPWFLPDGRHFLYVAVSTDPDKSAVYVGDLASKMRKQVLPVATKTIYVNPGYLLYVRDGTLMAQPFDTSKLETSASAVPIAEQVDMAASLGMFSASQNGVLMYTSGIVGNVQLTWFDQEGKPVGTVGAPGALSSFSLSPNGASVAFSRRDPQTGLFDIWIWDSVHRGESPLTTSGRSKTGSSEFPVWSADGAKIFYAGNRSGTTRKIYQKNANNTGPEEVVEDAFKRPSDASSEYLITEAPNPQTGLDIWVLPLSGDGKPHRYVHTEFSVSQGRLSPDGRWLAYRSNESKQMQVCVVGFPQPGGKRTISTNGGDMPVWSHDGRKLYYRAADGKIMEVRIKPGAQFDYDPPKALFPARIALSENGRLEVSGDGRFLLPALAEQQVLAPMTVVLNWAERLKRK
jgi:Tol biopolymer transport system component